MLFRAENGELIEINRHDYKTDTLYFKKILELKSKFAKVLATN